jgi:membrane protein DedA with SNARE-associated domain
MPRRGAGIHTKQAFNNFLIEDILEFLIAKYGYFAILIGTIVEGGTLLYAGGLAAHQGYLQLVPWVILVGLAGSFIDAQIWFLLGRSRGSVMVVKHPKWKARLGKINLWLKHYHCGVIVFSRFIPGFRTAGSLAAGMSRVPPKRFILFTLIGASCWSILVAVAGFMSGRILSIFLGEIKHMEPLLFVTIIVIGAAIWCFLHFRR